MSELGSAWYLWSERKGETWNVYGSSGPKQLLPKTAEVSGDGKWAETSDDKGLTTKVWVKGIARVGE